MSETASHRPDFMAGRNINGYFTFHLFINFAFWLPIYTVFFLQKELGYGAILLLYALDNGCQTILEIPTGMIADRWGRKPILMLGAVMQAAGFMMIAFGGSMHWYLVAMVFHGASLAFVSGTDAAFLYDSLAAVGRESEFKKIEGRAYMFNLIGWGGGGLLGGWMAAESIHLPWVLSGLSSILAFFVIGTCEEPPRMKALQTSRRMLGVAWKTIRRNGNVRAILILSSIIFGLLVVSHKFSQPYLQAADIPLKYFGVIYFVWLMCAAVSSNYSERIEHLVGRRVYFLSLPVLVGGILIYFGFYQNYLGVALALGYQFVWGSLRPQVYQIINVEVSSTIRATILSLAGFGSSIVYIIAAPLIGLYADSSGFPAALLVIGILSLVLGLAAAINLVQRKAVVSRYPY